MSGFLIKTEIYPAVMNNIFIEKKSEILRGADSMFGSLKKMMHDAIYDDKAEQRTKVKKTAVKFQKDVIVKMKCPMCSSQDITGPHIMYSYHSGPAIDFKRPNCYICKRCGYIMMFHDFTKVSDYNFEQTDIDKTLLIMKSPN